MIILSGRYFSTESARVSGRGYALPLPEWAAPLISSSAVFICPTRMQHLRISNEKTVGNRPSLHAHIHPFKISLTPARLDCFAS